MFYQTVFVHRYDYDKYEEDVTWVNEQRPSFNASMMLDLCPKLPIFQR